MTQLHTFAKLIRSKNAGPFQLTFDIMFDAEADYERCKHSGIFTPSVISGPLRAAQDQIRIFFCDAAYAIKISIPRPYSQGDLKDSDGHGGQQYAPLVTLEIP